MNSTRWSASACEDTSITQAAHRASTISRSRRCRSGASGVVRAAHRCSTAADAVADRADAAAAQAGGVEDVRQQVAGRGLAVRAGDADADAVPRSGARGRPPRGRQREPRVRASTSHGGVSLRGAADVSAMTQCRAAPDRLRRKRGSVVPLAAAPRRTPRPGSRGASRTPRPRHGARSSVPAAHRVAPGKRARGPTRRSSSSPSVIGVASRRPCGCRDDVGPGSTRHDMPRSSGVPGSISLVDDDPVAEQARATAEPGQQLRGLARAQPPQVRHEAGGDHRRRGARAHRGTGRRRHHPRGLRRPRGVPRRPVPDGSTFGRHAEMPQRGLGDPLEHRRGDGTAVEALPVRRVDHDEHRDAPGRATGRTRRTTRCSSTSSSGRSRAWPRCRSCRQSCSRRCGPPSPCRAATTASMIAVSLAAVSGATAAGSPSAAARCAGCPRCVARTSRGSTSSPPVAIELTAATIWIGVTPI